MTNLDLYAKAEHLLGIEEASEHMYNLYRSELDGKNIKTLLDVGCGRGGFMQRMQSDGVKCKGIDLSSVMIEECKLKGLNAQCIDIADEKQKYDAIVSIFDVLNFMNKDNLSAFLNSVANCLEDDGVFIADINTLYGFENVAVGSFIVDDNERFLTVDSDFENAKYTSEFTLFEKTDKNFKKSQETICQYYHSVDEIVKLSGLELVVNDEVDLYEFDEADKRFLVLKRV